MWPAYTLLNASSRMHKVNPHPKMKPGFYSTYNPSLNCNRKSDREKFIEDKILLLKMLPKFYFFCCTTKPNPLIVGDKFTHLLQTMFETKEVTLLLIFAATLFLDIYYILCAKVDYGFKRLTDATHFVVGDSQEEIKFHKDIKIETWPKQNDDIMQHFVNTIEFWVHKDQQREIALRLNCINTPELFRLYCEHP